MFEASTTINEGDMVRGSIIGGLCFVTLKLQAMPYAWVSLSLVLAYGFIEFSWLAPWHYNNFSSKSRHPVLAVESPS